MPKLSRKGIDAIKREENESYEAYREACKDMAIQNIDKPITLSFTEKEQGRYLVYDCHFNMYGDSETKIEALKDYCVSLLEYLEITENAGKEKGQWQAEVKRRIESWNP